MPPSPFPSTFSLVESTGHELQARAGRAGTDCDGHGRRCAGCMDDTLTWTGSLTGDRLDSSPRSTTTVKRTPIDVFSVTNETVSTSSLSVTGTGAAVTTTPANSTVSLDVLPCGGAPLDQETCTGAACTASATQGGVQFSVNAGTPSATTDIFLTGFTQAPPPNVCPGFNTNTNGVQFDIRPLTTDGTFEMVIPKSALQSTGKKWWQTEVCLGTNLRFITKLNSLANLRPGATPVAGGTPARPPPRSLVGSAAEHSALHAPAEHRLGSGPVGQPPLGSCQRRRRDQVRRPVRRELDVADDGREGGLRPEGVGRLARRHRNEHLSTRSTLGPERAPTSFWL